MRKQILTINRYLFAKELNLNSLVPCRDAQRYELERNSLRLEMDKMKQASRTHAKMLKKGHEQVLADQRKLIQNLEDMVSEQEQANGMDGKKGTAVSLQRLVEQISSLHKDKTSLIEDNVELQQKVQVSFCVYVIQ